MIDFRSDNTHGASPEVLHALQLHSAGTITSYGEDPLTSSLLRRCRDLFETDVEIFPVASGTAGNALSIAALSPPWGAVFCHDHAHVHRDEMGAPEFFTGGAKLIPIAGSDGKLQADSLRHAIDEIARERRAAKPACVSLTEATEAGTVYSVDEVRALCEVAKEAGCRVHMDGARFANAVASSGASPADLTWRAGVDILVLGATKNGAMAAELIVVFDRALAAELPLRWQRSGHRLSKMRFLSAQLDAYLTDELWLRNARHANAMAQRLASALGSSVVRPVQANVVFARFSARVSAALREQGFLFYEWPLFDDETVRLATGFGTSEADVDAFIAAWREECGRPGR